MAAPFRKILRLEKNSCTRRGKKKNVTFAESVTAKPPPMRTIRIICRDPDATDSSSDEDEVIEKKKRGIKKFIQEFRVPFPKPAPVLQAADDEDNGGAVAVPYAKPTSTALKRNIQKRRVVKRRISLLEGRSVLQQQRLDRDSKEFGRGNGVNGLQIRDPIEGVQTATARKFELQLEGIVLPEKKRNVDIEKVLTRYSLHARLSPSSVLDVTSSAAAEFMINLLQVVISYSHQRKVETKFIRQEYYKQELGFQMNEASFMPSFLLAEFFEGASADGLCVKMGLKH
ncbi:hypothetical protein MKW92_013610 [Papaver armeniacum]|nr:hypothetical protein MKW92_013610 [Papaver armeniacum]